MSHQQHRAPLLSYSELCKEVARLSAQVQFLLTSKTFAEDASMAEINELRRVVIAEPPRNWITTAEAATLVGRTTVTITSWCRSSRRDFAIVIGVYDGRKRLWKVDRDALRRYYVERFGADRLPRAFADSSSCES